MNKIKILKTVVGTVASIGAYTVAHNAIKSTTPRNISKINKFLVLVGTVIIGGIVSEKAEEYAEVRFDESVKKIKTLKEKIEAEEEKK